MGKYSEEDFKNADQFLSDGLNSFLDTVSNAYDDWSGKAQTAVDTIQFGQEYAAYKVNETIIKPTGNAMKNMSDSVKQDAQEAAQWFADAGQYVSGKVQDGVDSVKAFSHECDASLSSWIAGKLHSAAEAFDNTAQRDAEAAAQSRENIESRNERYSSRALEGVEGSAFDDLAKAGMSAAQASFG